MINTIKELMQKRSIKIYNNDLRTLSLNHCIFYGELLNEYKYYKEKGKLQFNDSFFSSIDNITKETGLKRKAQNNAIKELKKQGYIAYKVKRNSNTQTRFFEILKDSKGAYQLINKYLLLSKKLTAKEILILWVIINVQYKHYNLDGYNPTGNKQVTKKNSPYIKYMNTGYSYISVNVMQEQTGLDKRQQGITITKLLSKKLISVSNKSKRDFCLNDDNLNKIYNLLMDTVPSNN